MRGDHGSGVAELIRDLIANDLGDLEGRLARHRLLLGARPDGAEVWLRPYGTNLLIAGPSGSGKSTVATALLERLAGQKYQFCIVDPEGDYETFEGAVTSGDSRRGPSADHILQALANLGANAVANLVGLPLADRPTFFTGLLARLQEMRVHTGRPHWLVVDEAHHLLPANWQPSPQALPQALDRVAYITVHPNQVARAALSAVESILAVGPSPGETIGQFCEALQEAPPSLPPGEQRDGEVVLWSRKSGKPPVRVRVTPARAERRRHVRKYAEGQLPPERSFYFQGPDGKLNLRAQNLFLFLQLAEGVDDETWKYHLRRGDYSRWLREMIKDEELAAEVGRVESLADVTAARSRELVKTAIERHYTLPVSSPMPVAGAG
jgi:energy-coupling factor transporter ATP-binding protein EcfA2